MQYGFVGAFAGLVLSASTVFAADISSLSPTPAAPAAIPSDPFFNEVRLGVFDHGLGSPERNGGADVNAELLFAKPFHTESWTESLIPRPMIGATANFEGKTSTIYGGVTWHFDFSDTPLFAEISSGASLNNGQLDDKHNDMNPLGCHALLREAGSLGYRIDAHWSVMATVEHSSNAGLCSENRGLTNAGVRVGYRF